MSRIKVNTENNTGRNTSFNVGGRTNVSRAQVVREIEGGKHPGYHVADINGVPTPRANPNSSTKDNIESK